MTDGQLQQIDDDLDAMDYGLEFEEVEVPVEFLPPEPDDEDRLPSQIHPSYPYGNPTKAPHPSTAGTVPMGILGARALFEDVAVERKGFQTRPNWTDLGLDQLYRADPERVEAAAAAAARHTNQANPQAPNNGDVQQPEAEEGEEGAPEEELEAGEEQEEQEAEEELPALDDGSF
ncbi:hypothetical protein DACRYDRAFT_114904 [Dacryopinax primogenitus]|uniref:Uncharacterized protein n=1 Tax=Dacryopinax primogenitus (strain DJM 731) TaxID=1858805 RepID=M5G4A3_DACPD|nr:uncharacterized protein DACRYDRAFT_114904 [Dacryopinax primogenitus]EJU03519.1 hypothetical protein DACRYDRAFT_114904 [Dacryopinax primogenitus]